MQAPISDRNPSLEEMWERGWAWVSTNRHGKYGAPHTDDDYAADQVRRYHNDEEEEEPRPRFDQTDHELRVISWEEE